MRQSTLAVRLWIGVILLILGSWSCSEDADVDELEPSSAPLYIADPTIFFHEGTYYLYGTADNSPNTGFEVYTSQDLVSWEGPAGTNNGYALHKNDSYGDQGFWAPQVFTFDGKFYMAYTANENIAIAESDSPLGPFVQENNASIEAPIKQIDPFVFFDEDGKAYLYFVRLNNGNRMYVAEMTSDLSAIKEETVRECIAADQDWENTESSSWSVAEGPTVIKHKDLYYFVYSANDFRNPDYAVGYAVSESPLGPWTKVEENPILSRGDIGHSGTGHGDLFQDENGAWQYVFHTHLSSATVLPRKTALVKAEFATNEASGAPDQLIVKHDTFFFLQKE